MDTRERDQVRVVIGAISRDLCLFMSQLILPAFLESSLLHGFVYYSMHCMFRLNEKQKAWILTLFTSFWMVFFSLVFLQSFLESKSLSTMSLLKGPFSTWVGSYFVSYLIMDLLLGSIHYPKQLNFYTGYVHHIIYIFIVLGALKMELGGALGLVGIMELPTFILALGQIHPESRQDRLFGFTFFMSRIVFHVWFGYRLYLDFDSPYFLVMVANFPVHLLWFRGWIRQQMKRFNKRSD